MHVNNRTLVIIALLFCFTYFHNVIQAQKDVVLPWKTLSIEMSGNGKYLAVKYGAMEWEDHTPEYSSEIWIYDLENLTSLPRSLSDAVRDYAAYGATLAFSPNSEYLAVGSYHKMTVFNTENNVVILDLPASATPIRSAFSWFSFSPDSNYIAAFSEWWAGIEHDRDHGPYHEMSIWDIHTGQRIHAIAATRGQQWIVHPWLSPDWRQFLDWAPRDATVIYEFDVQQGGRGQTTGSIIPHNNIETVFSPDSSFFTLATWEEARVYETDTWTLKNSISLPQSYCRHGGVPLAFAHSHPWLASGCDAEGTISIWNYETSELMFRDNTFHTGSLEFTLGDAFLIASRSNSRVPQRFHISVWNTRKDFELFEYPGIDPQFHPNNEIMASIGPDSRVWIWNIKQNQLLVILPVPFAG